MNTTKALRCIVCHQDIVLGQMALVAFDGTEPRGVVHAAVRPPVPFTKGDRRVCAQVWRDSGVDNA